MPDSKSLFSFFLFYCSVVCTILLLHPSTDVQAQNDLKRELENIRINPKHSPEDEQFEKLLRVHWQYTLKQSPMSATFLGDPGYNSQWDDLSTKAIARRKEDLSLLHNAVMTIDRSRLKESSRLNYDLFKADVQAQMEGSQFPEEYLPVLQIGGVLNTIPAIVTIMPFSNQKNYQDLIGRLNALPTLIDQVIVLLDSGMKAGVTPPKITLTNVPEQLSNLLSEDPAKSLFLKALDNFPSSIPSADQATLRGEATAAVRDKVNPALRKLKQYLETQYIPNARESISLSALPQGKEWYSYRIKTFTTTPLLADEIHQIGLAEVKRIRASMDSIIAKTGYKGSFKDFCQFLRTDPQFFYATPEELLAGYRDICKRIDPELIKLFGKLPRLPYGVTPVPSYDEKVQTTAYYMPGSLAAGRPGFFCANTYDLKTRPKWEMEALAIHEAVPGHHLQIALAQEMENVPEFRKNNEVTAFVEGWGLYAESLGDRMGFYKDPYTKFGQLTYEMWRAIRLVVDTGMHSMGWSREQAIAYFEENSAKTRHDIEVEIDRYIVWPGQALAYKIGELKIKELRKQAEQTLGAKFDIRAFHDALLKDGALPLEVLETKMARWLKNQTQTVQANHTK